ncbi:MAG: orotidine 5'-phosphate decarboxylase [Candidatus Bathyarchaeota archaeon]|nr:orotidine 5'-phosphate decarboxylase [Candidatus Bathyarchaeota archaeon]
MSFEKPILQVALDFVNLHRALSVAEEAVAGGVDWIEVGTPLIKSEGLDAVRELKKTFPDKTIVADMKIMDVGSVEVQIAAEAGAEVVMMLGVTDDSTIHEGVEAGKRYGAEIMVDLINVEDMITRSVELERLGVHYICVHVGIDQQMRGMDPIDVLMRVAEVINVPVAVAGGINSESAAKAVNAGANIVIVGGAITKAENAEEATRNVKQAMDTGTPIASKLFKKYDEENLYKVYKMVSTPNISDALQRKGEMRGIRPVTGGVKAVGKAVTVRAYPGDWAKPVEAIDVAGPGDIIVIEAAGGNKAVWGELATCSCIQKKVEGVVIDGAIRDVDVIQAMKFPAFAKHVTPTAGDPKGLGEINVEIVCGGLTVRPRDWIIADDNGIIVVPKEMAVEIANRSLDVLERENRIRGEINQGSTLSKVLRLKKWEKIIG